ncbi:MAG: tRNA lysidine(34) synthetase TilS [Eubacterium sp.]|nr:tRNA lysidine(34) synthetase TilS [Eubacterium sp.]
MKAKVREYINKHKMIEKGDRVLLGLSGGADSVCLYLVLVELMEEVGFDIVCVHINHGIRGEEAKRDADFCERLCKSFGTEFLLYTYDIPAFAKENSLSEEEAGRIKRYETFEKVAEEKGCSKIAVAHHMNDNAETMLFNLARGSGVAGLCAMAPVTQNIIRPLLAVKRDEIEKYLGKIGQTYMTDSTNLDNEYSRNKIRNSIIPELEKLNTAAVEHINKSMDLLREMNDYVLNDANRAAEGVITEEDEDEIKADIKKLLNLPAFMRLFVIKIFVEKIAGQKKDISFVHIEAAAELLNKQNGKMVNLPYNVRVLREYDVLRITRVKKNTDKETVIELGGLFEGKTITPRFAGSSYELALEKTCDMEKIIAQNPYTKFVDCDKISDSLKIRHPKAGDYLVINDKGDTKKLSRLFIDEKIPKESRETMTVFADGDHIIWAVGTRLSSFYKVSEETTDILKISLTEE